MTHKLRKFLPGNDWESEVARIGNKEWFIKDLVDLAGHYYSIDIMSLDLCVVPWEIESFADIVAHMMDVQDADDSYPILVSPEGWILNGWHRVAKAILDGKTKIRAKRLYEMPEPNIVEDENEQKRG